MIRFAGAASFAACFVLLMGSCTSPPSPPPIADGTTLHYSRAMLGGSRNAHTMYICTFGNTGSGWELTVRTQRSDAVIYRENIGKNLLEPHGIGPLGPPLWLSQAQQRRGVKVPLHEGRGTAFTVTGPKKWKGWDTIHGQRNSSKMVTHDYYYDRKTGLLVGWDMKMRTNDFAPDPRFNMARDGAILMKTNVPGLAVSAEPLGYHN